jgi:hypothetical protein
MLDKNQIWHIRFTNCFENSFAIATPVHLSSGEAKDNHHQNIEAGTNYFLGRKKLP